MSVRSEAKNLELVSQMSIRLRGAFLQGLKPAFAAGLIGTAEELAETLAFVTLGAKARIHWTVIAALKRYATQNRSFSANSEAAPSHKSTYETAARRNDE